MINKPLTPTQAAAQKLAKKIANAEKVKTRRRIEEIKAALEIERDAA